MTVTFFIIGVTVLFTIVGFNNREIFDRFKFNAYDVKHSNQWYRFFSYGFLHAGYLHLFINMFVLYSFGSIVEMGYRYYFHTKYVLYYLLLYFAGLLLSVIPAYGKHKNDVYYNAVGASGAIAAVLFASILLAPLQKIYLFFIPIGIPAPLFAVMYVAYEIYMSRTAKDNIGHDAHFWGAVIGFVFTIAIKPEIGLNFLRIIGFTV